MFPESIVAFYAANQEALWLTTLILDLGGTVMLYRWFGKAGLQVAIATAIILANLQGPKLTVIFGMETSLVNLLEPGDKVVICINGVFGGRMRDICERIGANVVSIEAEWGTPVDPDALRAALEVHGDAVAVARQDVGGVAGVLAVRDLHLVRRQEDAVAAELGHPGLEGASGSGRRGPRTRRPRPSRSWSPS